MKPKAKTSLPNKSSTTKTPTATTTRSDNFVGEQQQQQLHHQQQQPQTACEVYVDPPSAHNSHEIIYATTTPHHQNQNFVYTTNSVNSTDVATPLEGNATTTTTTTIFAQPNAETFTFNAYEGGDLNVHNDPKVGNEYIVMADGSVENVMGKGYNNRISFH